MKLKILSWNIWCDGHFDEITKFLKNTQADIIGLQEVLSDNPAMDVIGFLKTLGYANIFAPVMIMGLNNGMKATMGNAVFSKYKIVDSKIHALSDTDSRLAVQADVKINNTLLHVFSTHLLHTHQQPSNVQRQQAENLIKLLPKNNTIVMGDFNALPESMTMQTMRKSLIDSDPLSAPTWSLYPEGCNGCKPQKLDMRLDYIFTTRDIHVESSATEHSTGSDHLPISVIITV